MLSNVIPEELYEKINEAIDSVNSIEEFNFLLNKWQFVSSASQEIKDECIRELKARKSAFYINPLNTPKNVFEDIKAGAADISDIGN